MILKGPYFVASSIIQLTIYLVAVILFAAVTNYHKLRGLKQH